MSLANKIVCFSHGDVQLKKYFESLGTVVTYDPFDPFDIAVFTPGQDVSPFLYGSKKLSSTFTDFLRDMKENRFYRDLDHRMPKIGIGRGAQFLNVMAGGTMWQHVSGHTATHYLMDFVTGEELMVTSQHHQQMVPPSDAEVLASCNVATVKRNVFGEMNYDPKIGDDAKKYNDTEVLWIDKSVSLCFQPRPELGHKPTSDYFVQLVDDWILTEVKDKLKE